MPNADQLAAFKFFGIKILKEREDVDTDHGTQLMVTASRECGVCKSRWGMNRAEPGCVGQYPAHSHPFQFHVQKIQPQGRPLCDGCKTTAGYIEDKRLQKDNIGPMYPFRSMVDEYLDAVLRGCANCNKKVYASDPDGYHDAPCLLDDSDGHSACQCRMYDQ